MYIRPLACIDLLLERKPMGEWKHHIEICVTVWCRLPTLETSYSIYIPPPSTDVKQAFEVSTCVWKTGAFILCDSIISSQHLTALRQMMRWISGSIEASTAIYCPPAVTKKLHFSRHGRPRKGIPLTTLKIRTWFFSRVLFETPNILPTASRRFLPLAQFTEAWNQNSVHALWHF